MCKEEITNEQSIPTNESISLSNVLIIYHFLLWFRICMEGCGRRGRSLRHQPFAKVRSGETKEVTSVDKCCSPTPT